MKQLGVGFVLSPSSPRGIRTEWIKFLIKFSDACAYARFHRGTPRIPKGSVSRLPSFARKHEFFGSSADFLRAFSPLFSSRSKMIFIHVRASDHAGFVYGWLWRVYVKGRNVVRAQVWPEVFFFSFLFFY